VSLKDRMVLSVEGQHAIVTGGGSGKNHQPQFSSRVLCETLTDIDHPGINLAFVQLLLSKGCSVIIADLALRPESSVLLEQYPESGSGPTALFHKTNVVSWRELTALWTFATQKFPKIDIVVPGAGLFEPQWSSFWQAPKSATNPETLSRDEADVDLGHYASLDVNLTAPIRLSQIAIGYWTQNKQKGCLVHVGSIAGYCASITTPLYFASKHGLHGFVRALGGLRDEVGIRVSCVAPGQVKVCLPSSQHAPRETELMMLSTQDTDVERGPSQSRHDVG
jgi:NAD(P)-dependent dehydrogenase (short-subunit alcohol dehydrogenase family)